MKGLAKKSNLVFLIAIRGIQIPQEADDFNKLEDYLQLANLLLQNNVEQWAFKLERILTFTYIAQRDHILEKYHKSAFVRAGATVRFCNGLLHNKDNSDEGYAYYHPNMGKAWWHYGKRHRIGAPAIIYAYDNNQVEWFYENKLHREDGPAYIECSQQQHHLHDGNTDNLNYTNHECTQYIEKWFIHGELHRENGPAHVSKLNDSIEYRWYKHGIVHRDNGPAIKNENSEEWKIDGIFHRETPTFCNAKSQGNGEPEPGNGEPEPGNGEPEPGNGEPEPGNGEPEPGNEEPGPALVHGNAKHWYKHGKHYRSDYGDGHIVHFENELEHHVYASGTKVWIYKGVYHRDDGPAIIGEGIAWYKHGLLHRDTDQYTVADSPTVTYKDGSRWYKFGLLHRDVYEDPKANGPALITSEGEQRWYQMGKLHRTDGPAWIFPDGEQRWYFMGQLHRTPELGSTAPGGPAVIFADKTSAFYTYGQPHDKPYLESSNTKHLFGHSGQSPYGKTNDTDINYEPIF